MNAGSGINDSEFFDEAAEIVLQFGLSSSAIALVLYSILPERRLEK